MLCALPALGACSGSEARVLSAGPRRAALNAELVVRLDGAVDPLTVGPGSVRLADAAGIPVPADLAVEGGSLVVRPVIGPAHLAAGAVPVSPWRLELAGGPTPLALLTLDGRRLGRGAAVDVFVEPRLEDGAGRAPRLVAVQGAPPAGEARVAPDGGVVLDFEGVLDPARLRPEDCELRPVEGGLELAPVRPGVDWQCRGRRFALRLRVPTGSGPLLLSLRRCGLRGLDGQAAEPPLEIVLR